jgi:hypothetical protein
MSNRADYLKKKKVVHQSPSQEEKEKANEDAQKNHCVKERLRVKERPTSAEKLGPKNKLISKS